jgi:membrane protease YdiL (CAAX protease family)
MARWSIRQRSLAAAFVVYWLVGFANNYTRTSPDVGANVRGALATLTVVLLLLALLFFAWQVARGLWSVETLGFTIGTWPSSILTAIVGAGLAVSFGESPLTRASFRGAMAIPFVAVLAEEILFRPVLIGFMHAALARNRRRWTLAVVVSAAIWALGHATSKSLSMVIGLFVSGVILGTLYTWSGSNMAGYVGHALAATGSGGAVLMFALCFGISLTRWLGHDHAQRGA